MFLRWKKNVIKLYLILLLLLLYGMKSIFKYTLKEINEINVKFAVKTLNILFPGINCNFLLIVFT